MQNGIVQQDSTRAHYGQTSRDGEDDAMEMDTTSNRRSRQMDTIDGQMDTTSNRRSSKGIDFRFTLDRDRGSSKEEEEEEMDWSADIDRLRDENPFLFDGDTCSIDGDDPDRLSDTGQFSVLIVFDTSALLGNRHVLIKTIQCDGFLAVIPYTVMKELDYLKTSNKPDLRQSCIRVTKIIFDLVKKENGSGGIFLENAIEASASFEGLLVEKNDDRIMKCALIMASEFGDRAEVFFVTNDRNLSLRAIANGLTVYSDTEWIRFIETDVESVPLSSREPQRIATRDFDSNLQMKFDGNDQNMPNTSSSYAVPDSRHLPSVPRRVNCFESIEQRILSAHSHETITLTMTLVNEMKKHWEHLESMSSRMEQSEVCKFRMDAKRFHRSLQMILHEPTSTSISVFVDLLTTLHRFYMSSVGMKIDKEALAAAFRLEQANEVTSQFWPLLEQFVKFV